MVSLGALSSGPAAGRDQTWAVFGKLHRQPGGMSQQEKQSLQFGFQVLRVLKKRQPAGLQWRLTLPRNVYVPSRFPLSTDCLGCRMAAWLV